ncbi:MAG: hypothetical protein ACI4R8_00860 [Candidatus Caccovivens sp.]
MSKPPFFEVHTKLANVLILGATITVVSSPFVLLAVDANMYKNAKKSCDKTIVETLNEKGCNIASVNSKTFELKSENETYLFKFTGSAVNVNNEKIDFFSASYEVNEQQYTKISQYMNDAGRTILNSRTLLNKLSKVIKESELVETNLNEEIAVRGIENASDFEKVGESIILDVTNPIVSDKKVSYKVSYLQEVKTNFGEIGLVETYASVEFDKTEELAQNPSKVFLGKEKPAKIKILDRNYTPVEENNILTFENNEKGL